MIQIRKLSFLKYIKGEYSMTGYERVYEYLKSLYGLNEPIFLSEVNVPEVSSAALRQQLKKLTTDGKVKRFDTGIYYLPEKSIFRSGSTLSVDEVINKKISYGRYRAVWLYERYNVCKSSRTDYPDARNV